MLRLGYVKKMDVIQNNSQAETFYFCGLCGDKCAFENINLHWCTIKYNKVPGKINLDDKNNFYPFAGKYFFTVISN